jgi:acetyl esterase/lipase
MCDFSQYGGASDEFAELLKTLPEPDELPVEELQTIVNRGREQVSEQEMQTLAPKVIMKDHSIPTPDGETLQARSYRPSSKPEDEKLPIYIHFHGGGFLFGTLDSENAACARIADDVQVVVLNVNYRHTPTWVFPAAWLDAEEAFEWAYSHADQLGGDNEQIVVGGISAGGHLSASLAQTLKRDGKASFKSLKGQVLMIPCVVHEELAAPLLALMKDESVSSYKENEFAPILPLSRMRMFNGLAYPKLPDPRDRRANPGLAPKEEIEGLPPATVGICGLDPLRDEAFLYSHLLASAGYVPSSLGIVRATADNEQCSYKRASIQRSAAWLPTLR